MPKRISVRIGDRDWTASVSNDQVTFNGDSRHYEVVHRGQRLQLKSGDRAIEGNVVVTPDRVWITLEGEVFVATVNRAGSQRRHGRDEIAFTPPMPATVVRIAAKPGDTVQEGDVLIALEAMKMELPIRAPRDGVVKSVNCKEGDLVQPDDVLLELE
jgi:biotin carboxyl carrier protein